MSRNRRRLAVLAGLVLVATFAGTAPAHASDDGAKTRKAPVAGKPAPATTSSAGPYVIIAGHTLSGDPKCLDVPGASHQAGVQIIQYHCTPGANNEVWYFDWTDSGYARIRNAESGLCLNVAGAGGSGAAIIQWYCVNAANGQWRGTYQGTEPFTGWDFYQLHPRHTGDGMCLNVSGFDRGDRAKLILYGCNPPSNDLLNDDFTWQLV
jgi:hypothetical protein